MKRPTLQASAAIAIFTAFLACTPAIAGSMHHGGMASATLRNAEGKVIGRAMVMEAHDHALAVTITAKGLAPGMKGVHIHAIGTCEAPRFASAGGHWNPLGHKHGRQNPEGAHMGDLPNLLIGANGRGKLRFTVAGAMLNGDGGLLDADGAAIVIHAGQDDERTDPSGNSGDRIACGVLYAD